MDIAGSGFGRPQALCLYRYLFFFFPRTPERVTESFGAGSDRRVVEVAQAPHRNLVSRTSSAFHNTSQKYLPTSYLPTNEVGWQLQLTGIPTSSLSLRQPVPISYSHTHIGG